MRDRVREREREREIPSIPNSPPPLELYEPGEYLDLIADLPSQEELPSPLIVADPSEFQERINEFGLVEYWNDVTGDLTVIVTSKSCNVKALKV